MNVTLEISEELRQGGVKNREFERSEPDDIIVYPEPHYNNLSARR